MIAIADVFLVESLKERQAKLRKSIDRLARAPASRYARGPLKDACDVLCALDKAALFAVEVKLAEVEECQRRRAKR